MQYLQNNTSHFRLGAWVRAARIRTLPLAAAAVGMGNLLHWSNPGFRSSLMLLSVLTTLFLQILSNFANDLGDSIHGADHKDRKGPERAVQSGEISRSGMRKAVLFFAVLSLASGISLLWLAFSNRPAAALPLFVAGLISIAAAWFYTNGSRPYGYLALGDPAVFIFFGLLAVLGAAWLQVQQFSIAFFLPASAMGFWSTAVMNLNNMRDVSSDKMAGKRTLAMILGLKASVAYQIFLVTGGGICLLLFGLAQSALWVTGAVPGFLVMLKTLSVVLARPDESKLDKLLKPQAAGTFLAVLGMTLCRILFS